MQEALNAVDATVLLEVACDQKLCQKLCMRGDVDGCEQAQREKVRVTLSMVCTQRERIRVRIGSVSKLRQEKRLSEFRERQIRL